MLYKISTGIHMIIIQDIHTVYYNLLTRYQIQK